MNEMFTKIKKMLKNNPFTRIPFRWVSRIKNKVVIPFCRKVRRYYRNRFKKHQFYQYNQLTTQQIKFQSDFPADIMFSIVVPVYNTPQLYLTQMIESVISQTYSNWQLCIVDGSDDIHSIVADCILKYAERDKRILCQKLDENKGISENTNVGLSIVNGDYICLLDHDDILDMSALYELAMAIKDTNADLLYTDENTFTDSPSRAYLPAFKPDYSPDTLRSYNYICHFLSFSKDLLKKVGGFRREFDGSQDYDLILRLTEKAQKIVHIPKILYYWRAHKNSVAGGVGAKPYAIDAAKRAISDHLSRAGLIGEVEDGEVLSTYRIKYEILGNPMISIIIPNKDSIDILDQCLNSIEKKTTYSNYEIIVVENNSQDNHTFQYYKKITENPKINIITWSGEFNYSSINNFAVKSAKGDYILLLNNDIEVITKDWLQEMLMFAQRKDVGAVGAKLYYPDDTIQHAGVILGLGGVAGHSHKYFEKDDLGYAYRLKIAQNLSAVTAACIMISKSVFLEVGELDEKFKVAFNDIDLCMKIREKGYLVVFTPFAELYHYESKSRGAEDTNEKVARFQKEIELFHKKWKTQLEDGDPYYNINLTLDREDFSY